MTKPKPVYKLPEGDGLGEFLSIRYSCGECKHVRDKETWEYYRLGDMSANAQCSRLGIRVSTHVGHCSAFSRPLTGHISLILTNLGYKLKDAYWWVMHRVIPWHRYHVAHTELKPGYYDPCIRIMAVVFNEAARFVAYQEDEANKCRWGYSDIPEHQAAYDAFKAAADYWPKYLADGLDHDDELAYELAKKVLDNVGHMWY